MRIVVFCLVVLIVLFTIRYLSPRYTRLSRTSYSGNIVNWRMYRTYKSRLVEEKMYQKCHQKWMDLNYGLQMEWYDDYDCDRFMRGMGERIWNSYQVLNVGAFKADFFRLCILYKNGGIYVDAHSIPYISLQKMTKGCIRKGQKHMFISVLDPELSGGGIHNGFIICSPGHPFLEKCIERIVKNIENRDYTDGALAITGPKCLAYAVNDVLTRGKDEKFKVGWNEYGELSFYLYRFQWGPFQYVFKDNTIILSKKYCTVTYALDKLKPTAYLRKWKRKEVYKN